MEFLDLPAAHHARGTVRLPGSKSISNRVLLLAALAKGTTQVRALLDSDDTRVMLDALRTLGVGGAKRSVAAIRRLRHHRRRRRVSRQSRPSCFSAMPARRSVR